MKKIIALAIVVLTIGATVATAKKKPRAIRPQFGIGQTATYEFVASYDFRNPANDSIMTGYRNVDEDYGNIMRRYGMKSGDSIVNRFSIRVLDASAYGYVMELRLIDIRQNSMDFADEDDSMQFRIFMDVLTKVPFRLMLPHNLKQSMIICDEDLCNQLADEIIAAFRRNRKYFKGEKELKKSELFELLRGDNYAMINNMFPFSFPGMDYFRSVYEQTYIPGTWTDGRQPDSLHKENVFFTQTASATEGGAVNFESTRRSYVSSRIMGREDNVDIAIDESEDSVEIDSVTTDHVDSIVADTAEIAEEYDPDFDPEYMDSIYNSNLVESVSRKTLETDRNAWVIRQEETTTINEERGVWTERKLIRKI